MDSRRNVLPIILILFSLCSKSVGQDTTAASDSTYHSRILVLPAAGSMPETGFLFGGVVVPQFKIKGAGTETRSSSILFSAIYTVKNQILTSIVPEIIFPREEWILSGEYYANYFPENYWGTGPFAKDDDEILALYTEINLQQAVMWQVGDGLFIGPNLRWSKVFNTRFEGTEGDRIEPPDISGAEGSTSTGIGWMVRWDRRNSTMTPTENHFVEFSILGYPSWVGSTDPFTTYRLDARTYFNLQENRYSVLAFQALVELTSGTPPFRQLSRLGGDMINRGYYEGRYRDYNAAQLQVELRQQAIGRLGFTLFAASGEVWNRFSKFTLDNFKWTTGAGLRFNINPDDPTNLRIDFGFGNNTSGFYLQFGEAF